MKQILSTGSIVITNKNDRVGKIITLIRNEYVLMEERQAFFEICERYSEIYHLEGGTLTYTNATKH